MRSLCETILDNREEVTNRWYQQYLMHFGDRRSLSEGEFKSIFGEALEKDQTAIAAGVMDEHADAFDRLGAQLTEHRVPLEEVIATIHLLKTAMCDLMPEDPRLVAILDKLNNVRIILLVSTYFRSQPAVAGERISAFAREAAQLPAAERTRFHGIVGASAGMRKLYQRIEAAAATRGNLLIVGESGTGKELGARAIHDAGPRADRPFVALNCAALPKDLIESELFGYKRGAFSGAATEYLGLFRAADGGTLFLDEITEMSAETQSKLLRAIQERAVRAVGSTRELPVDVRIIASTNRDPRQAVSDGHLRQDLYYRLQAVTMNVPTLRERREDIPLLVDHFITMFNRSLGRDVAGIEKRALEALRRHSWPGNVRELSNAIESAFTFGTGDLITIEDLSSAIVPLPEPELGPSLPRRTAAIDGAVSTLADSERDMIAIALTNAAGNKALAAKRLQISRKKLYAKIAKYGISLN